MRVALRVLLGLVVVAAPVAAAAAGYAFGRETRAEAGPVPTFRTWVDLEIHGVGYGSGSLPFLKCTYHLSDGTTRILDTEWAGPRATCPPVR